jgi:hypothetical protein
MKTTFNELLSALEFIAPQEFVGFYLNTALGVLEQDNRTTYIPAMDAVSKSLVHRVALMSRDSVTRTVYALRCQKTQKDGHIQYERFSFKLA